MPLARVPGRPARVRRLVARASRLAVGAVLVALLAPVLPAAAAEPDYPRYDSRYHTNAEMVAEIHAAEAAYPGLVDVMSIGKSERGRDIWVAKVSDNVAVDESEPEVMVDALHHARERLTLEQALYLLKTLTRDYASDPAVRAVVDSREIWIIFSVNPDGHVYDLGGNPYRLWRKNRQPTPGSRFVGTDLNRNYDYRWGCCGGSSSNPAAWNYRGPAPFSAPETRVVRDFVNSRVIDGRQQIRVHLTFHTNGEQVLWPYGYTKRDVPSDMTLDDYRTFVTIGHRMAARNGYRPMQSSDLYVTDGDEIDWMYGRHRIFSFTWELYPTQTPSDATDHYSPDEIIARETKRNREALLYTLARRRLPLRRDRAGSRRTAGRSSTTSRARRAGRSTRTALTPPSAAAGRSATRRRRPPAGARASSTRRRREAGRSPPGPRPARRPSANDLDGDDDDPLGAHRPAGECRAALVPVLLCPRGGLLARRLVPRLGGGDGRHPHARARGAGRRGRRPLRLGVGTCRDGAVGRADRADRPGSGRRRHRQPRRGRRRRRPDRAPVARGAAPRAVALRPERPELRLHPERVVAEAHGQDHLGAGVVCPQGPGTWADPARPGGLEGRHPVLP